MLWNADLYNNPGLALDGAIVLPFALPVCADWRDDYDAVDIFLAPTRQK